MAPLCRFHQSPSGCRNGTNCKFFHPVDSPDQTKHPGRSPSPSASWRRPFNSSKLPVENSSLPQAPWGVCKFYWQTGICWREFTCRHEHVRSVDGPGDGVQHEETTSSWRSPLKPGASELLANKTKVNEVVAPFLTQEGLTKINGVATDWFFTEDSSISPTEAHSRLKRFLFDTSVFATAFDVYVFLGALSSANCNNKLWTQEEGQLLLTSITSKNGSLRIVDIITWPKISIRAGKSRYVVSFQRGIVPLLRYLSSEFVVKSTLGTQANRLYSIILENLPRFSDVIEECMDDAIESRSFSDPESRSTPTSKSADIQIFASISGVLHEILTRFRNVVAAHARLAPLVKNLHRWFQEYHKCIEGNASLFDGNFKDATPAVRAHVLEAVENRIHRLVAIVQREECRILMPVSRTGQEGARDSPDHLGPALHSIYEGPGRLRPNGRRHNNDFEDLYCIRIPPTEEELLCRIPPFLPANFYSAPHPAPADSVQRLLDIQFRLLREELTYVGPLRRAIHYIHDDLKSDDFEKTLLASFLEKKGGRYQGQGDGHDSLMFSVYSGVKLRGLVPGWKGISTTLLVDTPDQARSKQASARTPFWEGAGKKQLCHGALVALVWQSGVNISVYLGIVNSREVIDSEYFSLDVVFFDSELEFRVLRELRYPDRATQGVKLLVESPVMYAAIRPFLEALQTEPEDIPFSRYLVLQPRERLESCTLEPPRYARFPGFTFQLASLFPRKAGVRDLSMSVMDTESIGHARRMLKEQSRLDASQADALVDALTREVALIQGPPGTGKSFTGVEILRVLQANKIGPILLIAFTNHALDHILSSVIESGIANVRKIVRLGPKQKCKDERVKQCTLEEVVGRDMLERMVLEEMGLEWMRFGGMGMERMVPTRMWLERTWLEATGKALPRSRLDSALASRRREVWEVQERITELMGEVADLAVNQDTSRIAKYLAIFYPEHAEHLDQPPRWISNLKAHAFGNEESTGEWQTAGQRGRFCPLDRSLYAFWRDCEDLAFIKRVTNGTLHPTINPPAEDRPLQHVFTAIEVEKSADDGRSDAESESSNRPLDESDNIIEAEESWKMIQNDHDYHPFFSDRGIHDSDDPFTALGFDQTPSVPSSNRSIEELLNDAGNVWAMSASERQRIHEFWAQRTGDILTQRYFKRFENLRDHHANVLRGCNEVKEEDQRILLENMQIIGCTTTGAAQSISLLKALVPKVLLVEEAGQVLEAHVLGSLVPSIEHVILIGDPLQLRPTLNNYSLSTESKQGQIYKFDMSLMERLSKSGLPMSQIDVQRRMRPMISSLIRNTLYPGLEDHELVKEYPDVQGIQQNVEMICDVVRHLLRQGCYSREGDIVVLCAYLGQLARLKKALADDISISIDERDRAALAEQGYGEDEGLVAVENVREQVRLRTVDNYQGEEGKIVILSLVRNSGDPEEVTSENHKPNIGFLKSSNRINVALSRAREGLYIFGNAQNLKSRSAMWTKILQELEEKQLVGPGLPIVCYRHPEAVHSVTEPGQLPRFAPDGGCAQPCGTKLYCGHLCPMKCHCDNSRHCAIACVETVDVMLPCGHTETSMQCGQSDWPEDIFCDFEVEKQLPSCEHSAFIPCGTDPSHYRCHARCNSLMDCCGKICHSFCSDCQALNDQQADEWLDRVQHSAHPCQGRLQCGHQCGESCSTNHEHSTTICREDCRQACGHKQCSLICSVPCAPCPEPCEWNCEHHSCQVPCGSACVRLPCDKLCTKTLGCGHPCPSVCGEDCDIQLCPACASADQKDQVVDLILRRSLEFIMPELGSIDEMLITNPWCRHVFTVETLDDHTDLNTFYSRDHQDTKWTGLLMPLGPIRSPTCPTCSAPVTSPRYGRIIKRAALDVFERNMETEMSRALDHANQVIQGVRQEVGTLEDVLMKKAANIVVSNLKTGPRQLKKQRAARNKVLHSGQYPVSEQGIQAANSDLHLIDDKVLEVWQEVTRPFLSAYKVLAGSIETCCSHIQVWRETMSLLPGHAAQARVDHSPDIISRDSQDHPTSAARTQIDQRLPLSHRHFLGEAFWITLRIRLLLIRLAQTWLQCSERQRSHSPFHHQQWATYIDFLLQTCVCDSRKAYDISKESGAERQILGSMLFRLRFDLETFRFNSSMCRFSGALKNLRNRQELLANAAKRGSAAEVQMRNAIHDHFKRRDNEAEKAWVEKNFTATATKIVEEWVEMERSLDTSNAQAVEYHQLRRVSVHGDLPESVWVDPY